MAVLLAAALGWRYLQGRSFGNDAPLPEGVVGEAGPVTVEALPPSKVDATPDATHAKPMRTQRCWPIATTRWLPMLTCTHGPPRAVRCRWTNRKPPSRPEPASATLETAAADE